MTTLTKEQINALNYVESGKNLFITSRGAGCGKTFLLNEIINKYKEKKSIAITASTGIASVLLKGITIHSWAGIGLGNKNVNDLLDKIQKKKKKNIKMEKS